MWENLKKSKITKVHREEFTWEQSFKRSRGQKKAEMQKDLGSLTREMIITLARVISMKRWMLKLVYKRLRRRGKAKNKNDYHTILFLINIFHLQVKFLQRRKDTPRIAGFRIMSSI